MLGISALQMLEDETGWLTNFTATREVTRERPESGVAALRNADNVLLAGHLTLISALMSCEGINKKEIGKVSFCFQTNYASQCIYQWKILAQCVR